MKKSRFTESQIVGVLKPHTLQCQKLSQEKLF